MRQCLQPYESKCDHGTVPGHSRTRGAYPPVVLTTEFCPVCCSHRPQKVPGLDLCLRNGAQKGCTKEMAAQSVCCNTCCCQGQCRSRQLRVGALGGPGIHHGQGATPKVPSLGLVKAIEDGHGPCIPSGHQTQRRHAAPRPPWVKHVAKQIGCPVGSAATCDGPPIICGPLCLYRAGAASTGRCHCFH